MTLIEIYFFKQKKNLKNKLEVIKQVIRFLHKSRVNIQERIKKKLEDLYVSSIEQLSIYYGVKFELNFKRNKNLKKKK
jgi:hypothetical protein